jgi:dTDP-glucose pyrophosphorylase
MVDKKFLIRQDATLREAVTQMNEFGLKCVFLLNSKNELIASLSDGDIRRSYEQDLSSAANAIDIANTNFRSLQKGYIDLEAQKLSETYGIEIIPVLQGDVLIDFYFSEKGKIREDAIETTVLIMAGGFGTRLRPYTDNCPKPLLPILDTSILELIIAKLVCQGFVKIIISVHFLKEKIKDKIGDGSRLGCAVEYISEDIPLGTCGCLSFVPKSFYKDKLLVINGDILTDLKFQELIEFHDQKKSDCTFFGRVTGHYVPYGVLQSDENGNLIEINEKPTIEYTISTGVYVFSRKLINRIPRGTHFDVPEVILLAKEGFRIMCHKSNANWLDVGTHEDYKKAEQYIENFDW